MWLDPSQSQLEAFQFGANEAPGTWSSLEFLWKWLFVAMPAQMEPLPWADITLVMRGNGNANQKIIVAREKTLSWCCCAGGLGGFLHKYRLGLSLTSPAPLWLNVSA